MCIDSSFQPGESCIAFTVARGERRTEFTNPGRRLLNICIFVVQQSFWSPIDPCLIGRPWT
jgi:hypothetical protein